MPGLPVLVLLTMFGEGSGMARHLTTVLDLTGAVALVVAAFLFVGVGASFTVFGVLALAASRQMTKAANV